MTINPKPLPTATFFASWLIGFLSIGPLLIAMGLLLHFLPADNPLTRPLHEASPLVQMLWISPCLLGALTITLIIRRQAFAFIATLLFALAYIAAITTVWGQFTLYCYAAIGTVILVGAGMSASRASPADTHPPDTHA
jgi:hypothetical protein